MAIRFWTFILGFLALILFGAIFVQLIGENSGANSYALLAQSFLNGEFSTSIECFDNDCIIFNDETYVIFPPFPAILAMPFIALFGIDFSGFIALSTIMLLASAVTWWAILKKIGQDNIVAFFLVIAFILASPLFFVTIRGDRVWFFAQSVSFLSLSLAIYFALYYRDKYFAPLLAGILIGCSFLSRQMTIFVAPFIFALLIEDNLPLFTINKDRLKKFALMALPIALAILIYFIYNYLRFGDILDTGYKYLVPEDKEAGIYMKQRILELGIFSSDYFLFNIFHLLFQGFHANFVGPFLTEIGSMDDKGTALLAASPYLFFLALTPFAKKMANNDKIIFSPRVIIIGIISSLIIISITLFYHSNGASQYNVQRYSLDWLPIIFLFLATAIKREYLPLLGALIAYGLVLNILTIIVVYFTI